MVFNPGGPGTPGPASARPKTLPRIRHRRISRPTTQANQGTQFPLCADQGGSRPRWTPRIRQGKAFLPPWGQANQGSQGFPDGVLYQVSGPLPLRFTARIMRGRVFAPPWGQAGTGVRFPLFTRQRRGVTPRWYPKIRQGHAFLPGWRQGFGDQGAAHFTVQGGSRPRWAPPHRVTAGRVFMPGLGQGQLGSRPPQLFFRQTMHPAKFRAGHTVKVSHPTLVWPAVIAMSASGHATISAFVNQRAAVAWTASGHMTTAGTRQQFAALSMHASGSMTIAGTAVRQARIAMSAKGSMGLAAKMTKFGTVTFTAAGSLHIAAVTTRQAAIHLTAAGSMTTTASMTRAARIAMTASGSMALAGSAIRTAVIPMSAAGSMVIHASATRYAALAMTAAGAMSVTATTVTNPLTMRATGSMTIGSMLTTSAAIAMSASGGMAIAASAGPPGRIILIESGAVTEESTPPQTGPFVGPSVVQVTEIED